VRGWRHGKVSIPVGGPVELRNAASALSFVPRPIPVPEGRGKLRLVSQFGAVRCGAIPVDALECTPACHAATTKIPMAHTQCRRKRKTQQLDTAIGQVMNTNNNNKGNIDTVVYFMLFAATTLPL